LAESLLTIQPAEISLDGNGSHTFFGFERSSTGADDRHLLEDCSCFNLHIPLYVTKGWPEPHGPAHPGVFEDAFPAILSRLLDPDSILTLHLGPVEPRFFDELTFIRDVLTPRRMEYVMLPSRLDPKYPAKRGNLLFEWPLDSIQHIADHWFKGFLIAIEGYVSRRSCLGELAELYFQPYNAGTIRKVLRTLGFGFKLSTDNNGLFILSDKLSEDALRQRLMDPKRYLAGWLGLEA
jgi:hypothetical protein